MNNKEKFFDAVDKFQNIAKDKSCESAEKWLNIALMYDYIPLACKERIDYLLKKKEEIQRFNIEHIILDKDIEDIKSITQVALNTRFQMKQLQRIEEENGHSFL